MPPPPKSSVPAPTGVFAVQCPNPKCRKYMLVEDHDRAKGVVCLICSTPIQLGQNPPPPPPRRVPK